MNSLYQIFNLFFRIFIAGGIFIAGFSLSLAQGIEENYDEQVVVLAALDKITTRLSTIEIGRDEMVRFGTLEITMRKCRSNPPEETPENVAYLEIVDVGHDQKSKEYFSGWMFSSSPALSPLEHPVYDVWVMDCKTRSGPKSEEMP